jgi:hypothetical protein
MGIELRLAPDRPGILKILTQQVRIGILMMVLGCYPGPGIELAMYPPSRKISARYPLLTQFSSQRRICADFGRPASTLLSKPPSVVLSIDPRKN